MSKCGSHGWRVRSKKHALRRILLEIWFQLLCWDTFLRLSPRAFLGGPHPGLFMSWASEHQKRKMDPIADFMKSNLANARGRIEGNTIVINSTWSICLRQNHSRPSTPHGSQDYSRPPHTPAESQKSGAPLKAVKNDASEFRCRNFCSAESWPCPTRSTFSIFFSHVPNSFTSVLVLQSNRR